MSPSMHRQCIVNASFCGRVLCPRVSNKFSFSKTLRRRSRSSSFSPSEPHVIAQQPPVGVARGSAPLTTRAPRGHSSQRQLGRLILVTVPCTVPFLPLCPHIKSSFSIWDGIVRDFTLKRAEGGGRITRVFSTPVYARSSYITMPQSCARGL